MIDEIKCRYREKGICLIDDKLCDKCATKDPVLYRYESTYDPHNNVTRLSILDNRGRKYITTEIYGQLTEIAVKSYANELAVMLMNKGVL